MPRIAREALLYDGCYAHVISRSIRKEKIFQDREDFLAFRSLLKTAKRQGGFQLFHYCIMHTHFHLAVMMPDAKAFSKAIHFLKSQYCFKYHTKYRTSGPIWRERYKSLLIENEDYLWVCGEYIEQNPGKAGLTKHANDWPYSSHRCYNESLKDELTDDYDIGGNSRHVQEVCLDDERYFEGGIVVGSPYFRYATMKRLKGQ